MMVSQEEKNDVDRFYLLVGVIFIIVCASGNGFLGVIQNAAFFVIGGVVLCITTIVYLLVGGLICHLGGLISHLTLWLIEQSLTNLGVLKEEEDDVSMTDYAALNNEEPSLMRWGRTPKRHHRPYSKETILQKIL